MEIAYNCGEFINLYSQDNPILENGDVCYFMLTNNIDYHRPCICRGIIVQDKFVDGMNKQYYIRILDILESPKIINEFIVGKPLTVYPYILETLKSKKILQISKALNFEKLTIKVDAFFVRKSEQEINKLRIEYVNLLKQDIQKMLTDIETILT